MKYLVLNLAYANVYVINVVRDTQATIPSVSGVPISPSNDNSIRSIGLDYSNDFSFTAHDVNDKDNGSDQEKSGKFAGLFKNIRGGHQVSGVASDSPFIKVEIPYGYGLCINAEHSPEVIVNIDGGSTSGIDSGFWTADHCQKRTFSSLRAGDSDDSMVAKAVISGNDISIVNPGKSVKIVNAPCASVGVVSDSPLQVHYDCRNSGNECPPISSLTVYRRNNGCYFQAGNNLELLGDKVMVVSNASDSINDRGVNNYCHLSICGDDACAFSRLKLTDSSVTKEQKSCATAISNVLREVGPQTDQWALKLISLPGYYKRLFCGIMNGECSSDYVCSFLKSGDDDLDAFLYRIGRDCTKFSPMHYCNSIRSIFRLGNSERSGFSGLRTIINNNDRDHLATRAGVDVAIKAFRGESPIENPAIKRYCEGSSDNFIGAPSFSGVSNHNMLPAVAY